MHILLLASSDNSGELSYDFLLLAAFLATNAAAAALVACPAAVVAFELAPPV